MTRREISDQLFVAMQDGLLAAQAKHGPSRWVSDDLLRLESNALGIEIDRARSHGETIRETT